MKNKSIIDKYLGIGAIIRDLPYVMVFKTTNYCWFRCPHCCECSGPDQPREFIPLDVIHYYLSSACQDQLFSGEVVFTGGEIMSSYRFGDPKYVPTLLDMCMSGGLSTDIKTNAGWARTSFGEQIYKDLADVVSKNKPHSLQISLSLDKYHTNCIENNAAVLQRLAGDKLPVFVHIGSFDGCANMWTELQNILRRRGISIETAINVSDDRVAPITLLNDNVVVRYGTGILFDNGRAKNLPCAMHTEFPEFKFMTPGNQILMAFDVFGRVTLGENSGRKISTAWRARNDKVYKLNFIRNRLVWNARMAELRAMIFDGWERMK